MRSSKSAGKDFFPGLLWLGAVAATVLAIATAIECHQYAISTFPDASWRPSLIYGAILWFWWVGVAVALFLIARRWPRIWVISGKNATVQLLIAACIAVAHLKILKVPVQQTRVGLEMLLYMILWATCAALSMQLARQRETLQVAELKHQLSSAHLRALQMQLKPHFLFNTLNAITTLVELGRQQEALKTLSHLNVILRSTLAQQVPEKISLSQELAVVENYLAIEQIRFADRLRVEMHVDPAALDGLVPCFLLQPIIENAIRHGISQLEDSGLVSTAIHRTNGQLHILVQDNGPGLKVKSNSKGHGVGLQSTEGRLAHFYPERYQFASGERESGGFEVSIKIPYEQALA